MKQGLLAVAVGLVWLAGCDKESSPTIGGSGSSGDCPDCSWELVHDGSEFNAIFSPDDISLYAVGDRGTIYHVEADDTTRMTSNCIEDLYDIWGTTRDNLYAVGNRNTILHYDGTEWRRLETGSPRGKHNAIWGSSANDIFVVGDDARVLHYDGVAWTRIETGYPTWNAPEFSAVWGSSASDVWIVGFDAIVQYNGDSVQIQEGWWTEDYYQTTFTDVHGTGPDDVYAVHSQAIQSWNGTEWSDFPGDIGFVRQIWVEAADHVYAIARGGVPASYSLFHYNGLGWSGLFNLDYIYGAKSALYPYQDGICVSWGETVWHFTGAQRSTLLDRPGQLLGTAIGPPDGSRLIPTSEGALRWSEDTMTWELMEGSPRLHYSEVFSPTDIVGIGRPQTIWRYDGVTWTSEAIGGSGTSLTSMFSFSSNNLFVVGGKGEVFHYAGNAWTKMDTPTELDLYDIWGSSPTDIYAVGRDERPFLHYDGSQWTELSIPNLRTWGWVGGRSASDVYVLSVGELYHYDGLSWSAVADPAGQQVCRIWAVSADHVYASSCSGSQILLYDGNHWEVIDGPPGRIYMSNIWAWSPNNIYAFTYHLDHPYSPSMIFHYGRH